MVRSGRDSRSRADFCRLVAFGPSPALSFALVNAVAVLIIASLCDGPGDPDLDHGRYRPRRRTRHPVPQGRALQSLRDADVVALDKTGTLTKGRPELTDLVAAEASRPTKCSSSSRVRSASEHPIAEAIVRRQSPRGSRRPRSPASKRPPVLA